MRKPLLGVLGAIAIAIMAQGTTFAATPDATAVTPREGLSSTSSGASPSIPGDSNLSNQNHSQD